MAKRVVLHVGLMKSGTTYVQGILGANRTALGDAGVLYPGPSWAWQKAAVTDLREMPGAQPGMWDRLCGQIRSFPGDTVVSVEHLAVIGPRQIRRVCGDLGDAEIHAVITARDLGRTIPAMWQESVKNGGVLDWPAYVAAVRAGDDTDTGFWRRQRVGALTAKWVQALGPDRVTVVVVPPPGAPREALWQRFQDAAGLPTMTWAEPPRANESLGAPSAELMRRINLSLGRLPRPDYRQQVKPLGKCVLPLRRAEEPALGFTPGPWVSTRAERQAGAIRTSGARVVGDLAELTPVPTVGVRPREVSPEEQLDAAVAVIGQLLQRDAMAPWRTDYWSSD